MAALAKAREAERERFLAWLNGSGQGDADWMDRLKDVALYGGRSRYAPWLERMAGESISARRAYLRVVAKGLWDEHAFVELMREDFDLDFPDVVLKEAGALQLESLFENREDLTFLDAVTIDHASTTDMDDAVSIQFREDGGVQVGVHITDVAALIPVRSALDEAAQSRGASLYLPEATFPMLPPNLSENLGSLLPRETRLTVSLLWDVGRDGVATTPTWALSAIRCCEKLSYEDVDAILDDETHPRHAMLSALFHAAESLLIQRVEAGAIAVDQVTPPRTGLGRWRGGYRGQTARFPGRCAGQRVDGQGQCRSRKIVCRSKCPGDFSHPRHARPLRFRTHAQRVVAPLSGLDAHARCGHVIRTGPSRGIGRRTLLPGHFPPAAICRSGLTATTRGDSQRRGPALFV